VLDVIKRILYAVDLAANRGGAVSYNSVLSLRTAQAFRFWILRA
jgi:hypothetical protein